MKKALRLFILLWGLSCFSQTGIGTVVPQESAVLDLSATDKALLLSRVDNTGSITNPENGMVIYDKTDKCIKVYQDDAWSGCIYIWPGSVTGLDCTGVPDYGELREGEPAANVYSVISYTGGDGAYHNGQTVTSTGVTGLTATLAAGSFVNGSGSLTYTITGTPSSNGTASFAVNIGGQSCTLTRTVVSPPPPLPSIPSTITLASSSTYIVASVYDQDYLPYTAPVGPATTAVQAADGSNETVTLNIQGSITTAGVAVKIPVTATGSGTLAAYSTTITIPAAMTEDGVSRDLTLSWAEQAYTLSTTAITATIAAVGGTLNAKKLDVNAGIGNDGLGVLMGNFIYPYNSAGDITNYEVRNVSAIPDKMFGLPDNTGSTTSHQMLYLPVVAEDGNIWLNNNLGAHYANLNHAAFNPAQQATGYKDHLAYGSSFQWGRKADGHELMTYTSSIAWTAVNGITTTKSNTPTHALFIRSTSGEYDWRVTPDDTLWANEASANNPCPVGFKVPTEDQFAALETAANIINPTSGFSSALRFTGPGRRFEGNGDVHFIASIGSYWCSSLFDTSPGLFYLSTLYGGGASLSSTRDRMTGMSVRCIKD